MIPVSGTAWAGLWLPRGKAFTCDFAAFAERMLTRPTQPADNVAACWAPVRFREDYRSRANAIEASAIVLDVDGGITRRELESAIPYAFVAHTTKRDRADHRRWRVVLPLPEPIAASDYGYAVQHLGERVPMDRASTVVSQPWRVPCLGEGGRYEAFERNGDVYTPTAHIATARAHERARQRMAQMAREDARAKAEADPSRMYDRACAYVDACEGAISGAGGHAQTFRVAAKLVHGFGLTQSEALRLLAERYNPRCEPPWRDRDLARKVESAARDARNRDPIEHREAS